MALRFERVDVGDPAGWRQALAGIGHGYWHRWEPWQAWCLGSGLPAWLCVARDDAGVIAACPVAERTWAGALDLYTPIGFAGFVAARTLPDDFNARWSHFAAALGAVAGYFPLHPQFAATAAHSGLASDNDVFILALDGGADAVLARADRSVRRAMRAWEISGNAVTTDRPAIVRFVLEHYDSCLRGLGADPRSLWPPATLAAMFADPDVWVVGVEDEYGPCAMHSFAITGDSAEFHLSLSVRDGRRHTTALIGWGLRQLAANGIRWVNMGGGMTRDDDLARSKMKFRPRRMPFFRAREVYAPGRYRTLCAQAGVDAGTAGFHPAYRGGLA